MIPVTQSISLKKIFQRQSGSLETNRVPSCGCFSFYKTWDFEHIIQARFALAWHVILTCWDSHATSAFSSRVIALSSWRVGVVK